MKNFKKILTLILVIALTATTTLGITLALLTDETEIKHNVFTAGNVSVELTEKVDGETYGGVETTPDGAEYKLVAPGDELTKEVTVKNTGSIPAYVAVTVTMNNAKEINEAIDVIYENPPYNYSEAQIQAIYDHIFEGWGLNYTKTDAAGDATNMRLTITGDDMPEHTLQVDSVKTLDEYWLAYSKNWFANASDATPVIPFDGYYTAGMDTYEIKWTYYLELQPGEESTLFTGINVPEYFKNEQMAMFNGLEIDIQGAAIQAENFADAKAAFTALKAEQEGNNPVMIPVSDTQTLKDLAKEGGNVLLTQDIEMEAEETAPYGNKYAIAQNGGIIDGGDNGIDMAWYGDDYGIMTSGGTIRNLEIKDIARGIVLMYPTEDVRIDNITITDKVLYPINTTEAGADDVDLIVTNSTLGGWASWSNIASASFTDCDFVEADNDYSWPYESGLRPYVSTTFTNCTFEEGYYLDLSALGADCKVVLVNCTVDGVALTAANCGLNCDGTEAFCVELPDGRTLADCVIFR